MKRKLFTIILTGMVVLFESCDFTTLYPIFTIKDIRFNDRILGFWKVQRKDDTYEYLEIEKLNNISQTSIPNGLQRISDKGYLITRRDLKLNIISKHITFLASIGNNTYLDFYPVETEEEKGYFNFYKNHYVKMHSLYRIDMINDQKFELREFDGDFVQNLIDTKQIKIQHSYQPILSNAYIITAPTSELQAYLLKYAGNPKAYAKESIMEYVKLR